LIPRIIRDLRVEILEIYRDHFRNAIR